MISILYLLLLILGLSGLGSCILRFFGKIQITEEEKLLLSFGMGFGFFGLLLFFIGLGGFLSPIVCWVLFIAINLFSVFSIKKTILLLGFILQSWSKCDKLDKINGMMCAILFSIIFLISFSPYVGGDSSRAYLGTAMEFSRQGGVVHHLPENHHHISSIHDHNTLLPIMLYAFCITIESDTFAKIFHFGCVLFCLLSIFIFSRHWVSSRCAFYSALVFATLTKVFNQVHEVRVTFPLLMFCIFSLFLLICFSEKKESNYLVLSSIFIGFACCTKVNALCLLPFIVIFLLLNQKPKPGRLILFFAISFLIALPFYFRSYTLTGNPVYPYFNDIFSNIAEREQYNMTHAPPSLTIYEVLLLPLKYLFTGGATPLILTYLPLLYFFKDKRRLYIKASLYIVVIVLVTYSFERVGFQYSIFALPFLCVLTAVSMEKIELKFNLRKINQLVILATFILSVAHLSLFSIELLPSAIGVESREHFISRITMLGNRSNSYKIYKETSLLPGDHRISYMISDNDKSFARYYWYFGEEFEEKDGDAFKSSSFVISDLEIKKDFMEPVFKSVSPVYTIYKVKEE